MIHRVWRLSENSGDDNLGLACTEQGLTLGRTQLIERRDTGFVVRERSDIEHVLGCAYRTKLNIDRLMLGLATVAAALNANDQALARIAAVHLRIPDLPDKAARDAMEAADIFIKSADWNPALHPRAGTPPNPGWFAPTETSPAIRTAQNPNPAQQSDAAPTRSMPGDRFPTADAAAIAALLAVYPATLSSSLEYAGRIYQNVDGSFSYTRGLTFSQGDPSIPNRNCCPDYSTPGLAPPGTVAVASYHTHPDQAQPKATSAEFSGSDLVFYTFTDKLPGYVAGQNGEGVRQILRFTPGETISQGVSQVVGTISNGSFVPHPAYDPNLKPRTQPPGGDSYEPD